MKSKEMSLVDILHRALQIDVNDVVPLKKYLGIDIELGKDRAVAEKLAENLCKAGSNDIASLLRGGYVDYREVVHDATTKLGVKDIGDSDSAEMLEEKLLFKLFADALDHMSDKEKRDLFSTMNINERDIPYASTGLIIVQYLIKRYSGFAAYQGSIILANVMSKALLGGGLSFATNAALTRSAGMLLGPIGWIATGGLLIFQLAGPAYRKTVPAVVHIAMLRQMIRRKVSIGIVGDGSSGKDALIKAVFGLDTGNISPVAGSTSECKVYPLGESGAVDLINYPGFNDYRPNVNRHTDDFLHHTDVFVLVIDINRGISQTDINIYKKLQKMGDKPILVCLNKMDMARPDQRDNLVKTALDRIKPKAWIETVFDPDPRLGDHHSGCTEVYSWITQLLAEAGKETSHVPHSEHVERFD